MAQMKITTDEMRSIAGSFEGLITEWDGSVATLYRYLEELDAMWDGDASEAFKEVFNSDKAKYDQLSEMMRTYKEAINTAAQRYDEGEAQIKVIVTRT